MFKKSMTIIILFVLISSAAVFAQIPKLINYQGYLSDASGNPVNVITSIQFSIYNEAEGGSPVWTETQSVTPADGIFSVLLGSVTPIPLDIFDGSEKFLALQIGSDQEMTPRKQLVSVGYAYYAADADKLDGRGSAQYIRTIDSIEPVNGNINLVQGSNITITHPGANRIEISAAGGGSSSDNLGDHTAVQNILLNGHWLSGDGDDEGIFARSNGNVGVGVSAPDQRLVAAGNIVAQDGYIKAEGVNDKTGELGRWFGAYGKCNTSGKLGYLGSAAYGAYGQFSTSRYGYLGGDTLGVYGQYDSENYGYFGSSSFGAYGQHKSEGRSSFGYLGGRFKSVFGSLNHDVWGQAFGFLGGMLTDLPSWPFVVGVGGVYDEEHWGYIGSMYHAGFFIGDVSISGTLEKASGSFKIDHPLDPENKYLYHSFVESPDMMNVYNGNVQLDSHGEAVVALPEYFEALNRDFRYQLTALGAPGPNLYVSEKIADNRFSIAGGSPNMEVSWQVTGIRKDAYAESHPIQVEVDKESEERGKYIHPVEHGMAKSSGINWGTYQAMKNDISKSERLR